MYWRLVRLVACFVIAGFLGRDVWAVGRFPVKVPADCCIAMRDEYCIPSGFCHLPLSVKVLLGPPLIPAGIIIGVWVLIRERQYSEAATLRCVLAVFGGGLISTLGFALVIN